MRTNNRLKFSLIGSDAHQKMIVQWPNAIFSLEISHFSTCGSKMQIVCQWWEFRLGGTHLMQAMVYCTNSIRIDRIVSLYRYTSRALACKQFVQSFAQWQRRWFGSWRGHRGEAVVVFYVHCIHYG